MRTMILLTAARGQQHGPVRDARDAGEPLGAP